MKKLLINQRNKLNLLLKKKFKLVYQKKKEQIEFTSDMMSKKYKNLRLLKSHENNLIRYAINSDIKWFICSIITVRSGDYYISIKKVETDLSERYESLYKPFNREDLLNQLLK